MSAIATAMKKIHWIKLTLSIVICQLPALIGAYFTVTAIDTWYDRLNKPEFTPPGWLFGPVWTVLYMMIGVSLYLVWRKAEGDILRKALWLFFIHLVLNAGWSYVFFGLQSPPWALAEITILWISILLVIRLFYPIDKLAAFLLIPYLLWVTFAAALNYAIMILN